MCLICCSPHKALAYKSTCCMHALVWMRMHVRVQPKNCLPLLKANHIHNILRTVFFRDMSVDQEKVKELRVYLKNMQMTRAVSSKRVNNSGCIFWKRHAQDINVSLLTDFDKTESSLAQAQRSCLFSKKMSVFLKKSCFFFWRNCCFSSRACS